MTQKDKQLLLKDLCSRLPYAVKIIDEPAHCLGELFLISTTDMVEYETETDTGMQTIYNIKPYLRSLSSMTEDEERELEETLQYTQYTLESYDWLLAHHFDFRELIQKDLALEAKPEMYKI